jgi:hypothetical protein
MRHLRGVTSSVFFGAGGSGDDLVWCGGGVSGAAEAPAEVRVGTAVSTAASVRSASSEGSAALSTRTLSDSGLVASSVARASSPGALAPSPSTPPAASGFPAAIRGTPGMAILSPSLMNGGWGSAPLCRDRRRARTRACNRGPICKAPKTT